MEPINESVLCIAIRQCLETADHYIRQGNGRDARFYFDKADTYANRLIFCRQNRVNTTHHPPPTTTRLPPTTATHSPKGLAWTKGQVAVSRKDNNH
jgi:hypothetical protein